MFIRNTASKAKVVCNPAAALRSLGSTPRRFVQQRQDRPALHVQQPQQRWFSVSSLEIQKFSAMDSDWWDPQSNPLLPMNTIRVKYIRQAVQRFFSPNTTTTETSQPQQPPLAGLSALDIGCGGGLLSESLVRLGAHVTAIDPSVPLVQAAQAHADTFLLDPALLARLDYRGGVTAEDLVQQQQQQPDDENSNKFDIVCLLEVIEHATDPQALLQTAVQLLKPQGLLFISTMSPTLTSYLLTIVAAEHITGYVPGGTHDWNQYLHPHQVHDFLNQTNTTTNDDDTMQVQELDVQGMVLSRPPLCAGDWQWKLHPTDTSVNWIATYRKGDDTM